MGRSLNIIGIIQGICDSMNNLVVTLDGYELDDGVTMHIIYGKGEIIQFKKFSNHRFDLVIDHQYLNLVGSGRNPTELQICMPFSQNENIYDIIFCCDEYYWDSGHRRQFACNVDLKPFIDFEKLNKEPKKRVSLIFMFHNRWLLWPCLGIFRNIRK